MRLGIWLAVVALGATAACGSSSGSAAKGASPSAAPTFSAEGTVKADDVANVRYDRDSDSCKATGDLAQTLAVGKESIVLSDPNGKQVALAKISGTNYHTVEDGGSTYVTPGLCDFDFHVEGLSKSDGVYTASVPDLGITARFTPDQADRIVIRYDPR